MQTGNNPHIPKRKLTSLWALALFTISTITYCSVMYKCVMTGMRYEQKSTNAVDMYSENKTELGVINPTETEQIVKFNFEIATIKERETIIIDHLMQQVYAYSFLSLFCIVCYLIFKERFLRNIPMLAFLYTMIILLQGNFLSLRLEPSLIASYCIPIMSLENKKGNLEKMVVLFNSYIELLSTSTLFFGVAIVISAFFILFQVYMIAYIHIYVPGVSFIIYICLILYFLFSTFTTFFFLCSFIISLAFYSMLHHGSPMSVLLHSYQNVFYLSGEICNYGLNHYKSVIITDFSLVVTIYTSPLASMPLKILSAFIFLSSWFISPFLTLLSTDGYYVICFITLTGQSFNSSHRKVTQMVHDVNLLPYFGFKTEYSYYLKGIMLILLMRNYFANNHFSKILECRFYDKAMLLCAGLILIHFFTFLLNVMYSTVLFLFFICGDLMKERNPKLYKLFERKRANFLVETFNEEAFDEEESDVEQL